jgi:hypothetical protein
MTGFIKEAPYAGDLGYKITLMNPWRQVNGKVGPCRGAIKTGQVCAIKTGQVCAIKTGILRQPCCQPERFE